MSLVLDGLIIVCALWCVISGIRYGFIRSVIGLVKGVVSLLAAWAYTPVIRDTIKENYIIRQIAEGIAQTLRSLALNLDTHTYDLSKVAADLPEAYTAILDRYGIDIPGFTAKIADVTQADEAVIYDYSAQIADPCASFVASVVSFALLFLGVYVALSLAAWLFDLIFQLPVLSGANHFAGLVFGMVEAVFFAYVIAVVGSTLMTAMGPIDSALFGPSVAENTVICKFLLEHNILHSIMAVLQG
ncbi:MAG: CvpA family protein [Ruminococcaceae bacterium]|nr:CvpA family protein [Oscillospiraceae bacterium]